MLGLFAALAPLRSVSAGPIPSGAPFLPPLAATPLDTPLVVTDGYGERRGGHFHAGVDLSTGEHVGRPVRSPVAGWVERVRASGVGYGRSIYLHSDDGRLIQLGHLDAFAEPLASFVAAVQESSARYEQDLWPAAGRFRVTPGQQIAWSGESGAGPPHLHVEIRIGDMAMNPLRAGLSIVDARAPELRSVTLEPLDSDSRVAGSVAPWTVHPGARGDTVAVVGRVRVWVEGGDGFNAARGGLATWSTAIAWPGGSVECRFDSVSWAGDMGDADYVYGGDGIRLSAPGGFRPRVLIASGPREDAAGVVPVAPGGPVVPLRVTLTDVAGNSIERTLWLDPARAVHEPRGRSSSRAAPPDLSVTPLPGEWLRIELRGGPSGLDHVRFEGPEGEARPATHADGAWSAIVRVPASWSGTLRARGEVAGKAWSFGRDVAISRAEAAGFVVPLRGRGGVPGECRIPAGAAYEAAPLVMTAAASGTAPGLVAIGRAYEVRASTPTLRTTATIVLPLPAHVPTRRLGLYLGDSGSWGFVSGKVDSVLRRVTGESRGLGRFAVFEDRMAPEVHVRPPARKPPAGPYSRWALEARVGEAGSGVDLAQSWFTIDGHRVPSEWDPDARMLRWRPLAAPARGTHGYAVVVTDRAGNRTRRTGRFVID